MNTRLLARCHPNQVLHFVVKWARCFNRYNKADVRRALENMYAQLCCYCESRVGIAGYPSIEHRQPKKCYPEVTFDWNNLHLACQVCNSSKGAKWDVCYPILDSAQDTILQHLGYRIGSGGPKRWPKSRRGETTIDHAKLNRQKLLDVRTEIAHSALRVIAVLKNDSNSPAAEWIREQLQEQTAGQYGSLVSCLLDNCL